MALLLQALEAKDYGCKYSDQRFIALGSQPLVTLALGSCCNPWLPTTVSRNSRRQLVGLVLQLLNGSQVRCWNPQLHSDKCYNSQIPRVIALGLRVSSSSALDSSQCCISSTKDVLMPVAHETWHFSRTPPGIGPLLSHLQLFTVFAIFTTSIPPLMTHIPTILSGTLQVPSYHHCCHHCCHCCHCYCFTAPINALSLALSPLYVSSSAHFTSEKIQKQARRDHSREVFYLTKCCYTQGQHRKVTHN